MTSPNRLMSSHDRRMKRDTFVYTATKVAVMCAAIWLLAIAFDAGAYSHG